VFFYTQFFSVLLSVLNLTELVGLGDDEDGVELSNGVVETALVEP